MGIEDREYYRDERSIPSGLRQTGYNAVYILIGINVAIWVVDTFTESTGAGLHAISNVLAYRPQDLFRPWQWWKLLTAGFAHDPDSINHILFNMFGLWMFGKSVEPIYAGREFLRIYLVAIVVANLAWGLLSLAMNPNANPPVVGASGAVMGVVMLYILHFPRNTILLGFFLPVPAWVAGLLYIGLDLRGFFNPNSNVAHAAHLAGAAFTAAYWYFGWHLGRFVPSADWLTLARRRATGPKLRVHRPPPDDREPTGGREPAVNREAELDRILDKIRAHGQDSLTSEEAQFLQDASRRMRNRRD